MIEKMFFIFIISLKILWGRKARLHYIHFTRQGDGNSGTSRSNHIRSTLRLLISIPKLHFVLTVLPGWIWNIIVENRIGKNMICWLFLLEAQRSRRFFPPLDCRNIPSSGRLVLYNDSGHRSHLVYFNSASMELVWFLAWGTFTWRSWWYTVFMGEMNGVADSWLAQRLYRHHLCINKIRVCSVVSELGRCYGLQLAG